MPSQTGSIDLTAQNSASKTATNYITADADGIKIHMTGESSTYQHQTATDTTFYVSGKKRTKVGGDGLHIYVDTTETEVASFTSDGIVVGKSNAGHVVLNDSEMQYWYSYNNGTPVKTMTVKAGDNNTGSIIFRGDKTHITGFGNEIDVEAINGGSEASTVIVRADNGTTGVKQAMLLAEGTSDGGMLTLQANSGSSHDVTIELVSSSDSVTINGALLDVAKYVKANGSFYAGSSNLADYVTPSSNTNGRGIIFRDQDELNIGYVVPYFSTTGTQWLRISSIRGGSIYNNLYIGTDDDGNPLVTVSATNSGAAAAWRSAIGAAHNVWTVLGSVSGTTSLTINLTNYSEVLVTCRYSSTYLASIVLPKAGIHASTQWEIYLGGWGNNSTTSNRRAVAKLSQVKFTPVVVTTDQTDRTSSATWVVYAR